LDLGILRDGNGTKMRLDRRFLVFLRTHVEREKSEQNGG
jgi:hypothetical protein